MRYGTFHHKVLGIEENSNSGIARIVSNPVEDFLILYPNDLVNKSTRVTIFNTMGGVIRKFENPKESRFYVGDISPGLYLIEIVSKNNRQIMKMIKK